VIGAITALSMAFVGMVQNDIKRVVAYSTLSQLGYMMVALGASAYSVGIFHLMTHAFFKALLFLAAGSVIIALHHEQDLRKMGGLKRRMPITFVTTWIGSLALAGIFPFAGFFSKDMIILAVQHSQLPGSGFAYFAVVTGVFVTAFYTFRMLFLTYYGKPRMDEHTLKHVEESPWVVTIPLILLAFFSFTAGFMFIDPLVFGNFFADSIKVLPAHDVVKEITEHYVDLGPFIAHGLQSPPFLLSVAGIVTAWLMYVRLPHLPGRVREKAGVIYTLLLRKYFMDEFNEFVFAGGARAIGRLFWKIGDVKLIDGLAVNGTARMIGWVSTVIRHIQSGYVYHYAFAMILGLFLLITFFLHR
jgi:NADH-quinone oxidoreductase subunit L